MPGSDRRGARRSRRAAAAGRDEGQRRAVTKGTGAEPRVVAAGGCEIVVARHAGYCYGVERALRMTGEALARAEGPVATLGPVIHNPIVVADLEERGARVVHDIGEADGGTLVVRTHGVAPDVLERARARGLRVVDATCPFVTAGQRKARALREAGYTVVILGERDHPEVVGLQGHAGGDALVVEDADDVPRAAVTGRRVGVVVQTTQSHEALARLAATLAPLARELLVHNTVCDATAKRQSAACELAAQVDVVVVVGGHNSANTMRLARLCRGVQARTHQVERAAELKAEWLVEARRIGVTAGASTPEAEIAATVARLRELCEARRGG